MAKKRRTLSSFNSDGRRDHRMFKAFFGATYPGMATRFRPPPMEVWEQIKTPPMQADRTKER